METYLCKVFIQDEYFIQTRCHFCNVYKHKTNTYMNRGELQRQSRGTLLRHKMENISIKNNSKVYIYILDCLELNTISKVDETSTKLLTERDCLLCQ